MLLLIPKATSYALPERRGEMICMYLNLGCCLMQYFLHKDKDLFIGPQEFVVAYSKAPEQPQRGARPICHSHAMTRAVHEPATIHIAA